MAGGYTLQLDPIGYVNSATATLRVLGTLRDAGHTLTGALHGSAQMAGSDQGGQAWADSYDDAARSIIRNTTTMLNAFDSLGVALGITGYNHAVAEHRATGLAGTPGAFSIPVSTVPEALGTPASSHGGNREFPWGFQQLSDLIGMAWPDGDTGKLKAAGSAWDAFADALEGINTTGPLSHIDGFVAPEIAGITAKFDLAKKAIRELATQSRTVAKGCRKRASSIDDAHNKTAQELLQLAITIGATVAASALLTPFTLGISDAAGAGAVAIETGVSVARIVTWLTEAVEDAFAVAGGLTEAASAIEGVGGAIAQIGIRVAPYVPRAITSGLSFGVGNTIGTGIVQGDDADLGKAFADGFVGGFVGDGALGAGKVAVEKLTAAAAEGAAAKVVAREAADKAVVDAAAQRALIERTYALSIHNPNAPVVMLGKYMDGGPTSYIKKAGTDHTYFSLGADWDRIKLEQGLTEDQMFKRYNVKFLDDGMAHGKSFEFSHDPRSDPGALGAEFDYLIESGKYGFNAQTMTAVPFG